MEALVALMANPWFVNLLVSLGSGLVVHAVHTLANRKQPAVPVALPTLPSATPPANGNHPFVQALRGLLVSGISNPNHPAVHFVLNTIETALVQAAQNPAVDTAVLNAIAPNKPDLQALIQQIAQPLIQAELAKVAQTPKAA